MGRKISIIRTVSILAYLEAKADFAFYLQTLGQSPNSVKQRLGHLEEFFARMESEGVQSLEAIKYADLLAYESYLRARPNTTKGGLLSEKFINDQKWVIAKLFGYLQLTGKITYNPATKMEIRFPKDTGRRTILTQAQIKAIYAAADAFDRTWFALCYGCALRVMELRDLDLGDVHLSEGVLVVRQGKGNKKRIVPMTLKIMDDLRNYLQRRKNSTPQPATQALFVHQKGGRMMHYTFNKRLKKLLRKSAETSLHALESSIGMHCLRHSIATHLLENGVKMEQVKAFLGHSHLETTEIYTRISQQQLNPLSQ